MGMMESGQRDLELAEKEQRRGRGVYLLPGAFTVGNLLCGFYAVLATLQGGPQYDYAARAIGFAIVFDAFDGFVARMTRTNTEFGKQFDSLADMVSFGIAPAVLAFAWGVQVMMQQDGAEGRHVHQLAWLVCLAFVICCAWRLARFNVHGMAPGGGLRYFVGMPAPAAAGMIAATVHFVGEPIVDWRWSVAWLTLIVAVAAVMVSSIRYPSFKDLPLGKRQHSLSIIAATLLVGAIIRYSEVVLILMASAYFLSGWGVHVVRLVRHRLVSHTA